jgi:parallel beta-helix repeat protein
MSHVLEFSGVRQAAREHHSRRSEKRRRARNRPLLFEPLEDRRMLSAWPVKQADIWNTGRADYVVPSERLNDTFFDVFLWQQRTPDSPLDGGLSSTSMPFYDGVGPGGADLVVGGYHWPKGVQGMDRQTGELFWFGNPGGGELIGFNTPAFSNDGTVVYVTNDATAHPAMAFTAATGPADYWHNGSDPQAGLVGAFSPSVSPDGRIFLHEWCGRPRGLTDFGDRLELTWSAETNADACLNNPTFYVDQGQLRVVSPGRSGWVRAHDGAAASGAQLWAVSTGLQVEADATIDPANGNIYVSGSSANDVFVVGLDKTGSPLWGSNPASQVFDGVDGQDEMQWPSATGSLSFDGGTYYFQTASPNSQGRLYAINTADGSLRWSFATASRGGEGFSSSPIVTRNGVIIVGNNFGGRYHAIHDVGTEGVLLDTLTVDEQGNARASATLSSDGLLYLPLRTPQIVGAGGGHLPTYRVENLFTAIDLTAGATVSIHPPAGQQAVALNAAVALRWQGIPALLEPHLSHYVVYRATQPFTSVAGMTLLATVPSGAATEYLDNTAQNGTAYYYGVTAVSTGGGEVTEIGSVGPRTPRDETDLQVVSISRQPQFPRYFPDYHYHEVTEADTGYGPYGFSSSPGLLGGQTFGDQRFPGDGDPVTYTATIRNRGTNPIQQTLSGRWLVDGSIAATVSEPVDLAPGEAAQFAFTLAWDGQPHELIFQMDSTDERLGNNQLVSDTLAVPFLTYVDRSFLETFREVWSPQYPQAATDDLLDWLNTHMARFNELFAQAGTSKRVHYGVLELIDDDAPDPIIDPVTSPYAIFPLRYRHGVDDDPRSPGYYRAEGDIDYGLLHEMAHQLGLIDLYQLDVPASANQVSGLAYQAPNGLMRTVAPFISEHSALAMEHWLHVAHGYYGQYLYNIPQTLKLRLLDYQGQPLSGAQVTMYQYAERPGQGKVISNQAKATGLTDEHGYFTLPNVDINETLVPPVATGDVLQDNPFGYVAVVGTNGVLHFRVEEDGATDYCWFDITEANVAYWKGNVTEAVFDRQLLLGMPIQTRPPDDLAEPSAGGWIAWADSATATAVYDTQRTIAGTASLKFLTDGGFDTAARYPGDYTADWDLSDAEYLALSVYAENDNSPTFQGGSPWIRLIDADGDFFQYQYTHNGWPADVLNEAIGRWASWQIPLEAPEPMPGDLDSGWRRTAHGTPDLTRIQALEFHADTWGYGFGYWLDGVGFDRLLATGDAYLVPQNGQLDIGPDTGLLANDVAPSGTSLTAEVVAGPMHGQLVLNQDGSFVYTRDAGFVGADRFTYVARAGEAVSNVGEVLLDVLQTIFTVTNTDDSGPGSLREALLAANAVQIGPVTIQFQIPDSDPGFVDVDNQLSGGDPQPDVFVIRPLSPLPALENRSTGIVVDGRTQVALTGNTNPAGPVIVLDGSTEGLHANGLEIFSDGNAVFGLNLLGFAHHGIHIAGSENLIAGNYVGTDPTGSRTTYSFGGETVPTGNRAAGIDVWYSRRNVIRDNVISGNAWDGVRITGPEVPVFQWPVSEGGNGHYYVVSPPSTWAAAEALARQLDPGSNPDHRSSYLVTITSAQEQEFLNRRFFTDVFGGESFFMGLTDEAEEGTFVWVTGEPLVYTNWADWEPNNWGDEDYAMVNFHSLGKWNDVGADWIARGIIELEFTPDIDVLLPLLGARGNQISGNRIGTDAAGRVALPNESSGVFLENAHQTLIGGVLGDDWSLANGNLISGNGDYGVIVQSGCSGNEIRGNYIGTDIDGDAALGNAGNGIAVYWSTGSSIGGSAANEGNLISGNGRHGVHLGDWSLPVYHWPVQDGGNGHYYAVLSYMSWDAAERTAQAMGGHLASITSAGEQSFIRANILGDDAFLNGALWIGLNDILQEGAFAWTSGEPVVYTNWHPDEINGDGGDAQNAVMINARRDTPAERGTWSDAPRSWVMLALAEFPTQPDPADLAAVSAQGNHRVQSNRIGTTRDGSAALRNWSSGIYLDHSSRNVIGGPEEQGNVISGNSEEGIRIEGGGSRQNEVWGNIIGLTAAGDEPLGNVLAGVMLADAPENRIGPANVIADSLFPGVWVLGHRAVGNEVFENRIGTDAEGRVAFGNYMGVLVEAPETSIRAN